MAPRAIPPLLKRLNEQTVLETIRDGAPISRAEISRRAGISKPTVSVALQSLVDAGLVREAAPDARRPSFGAVYFEPVEEAALVLGVDVGARFLRAAICDLAGRIRARQDVELDGGGADRAVEAIGALRESLVAATGLADEPLDARDVFAAARGGDRVARELVVEEARRIALHIAPIAAVADVGLVVLGGGIGTKPDPPPDPLPRAPPDRVPYSPP